MDRLRGRPVDPLLSLDHPYSIAGQDTAGRSHDEPPQDTGGLGFFDRTKAVLEIELEIPPPTSSLVDDPISRGRNERRRRSHGKMAEKRARVISVRLQQDLGALKSRKGDTGESGFSLGIWALLGLVIDYLVIGSVLWRSRCIPSLQTQAATK